MPGIENGIGISLVLALVSIFLPTVRNKLKCLEFFFSFSGLTLKNKSGKQKSSIIISLICLFKKKNGMIILF